MPLARSALVVRSAAVVTAAVVGAAALVLLPGGAQPAAAEELRPYGSCEQLLEHYRGELVEQATPWGWGGGLARLEGDVLSGGSTERLAAPQQAVAADGATGGAVGAGPTGTNVQEQGVDEPDRSKLVGDLLVVVTETAVQLLRAGDEPRLLGSHPLGEEARWGPAEVLVDGDRVLVLAPGVREQEAVEPPVADTATALIRYAPPGTPVTRLLLLDVADPTRPALVESAELDGGYLSARLVDGTVRLVTSSTPQLPAVNPTEPYGAAADTAALDGNRRLADAATLDQVLPQVVRRGPGGAVLSRGPAVGCGEVRHASDPVGTGTLLVTTLRPSAGLAPQSRTGVTTDGDVVYATADRLYVATSRWGTVAPRGGPAAGSLPARPGPAGDVTTEVHGFDTTGVETRYLGSGSVDGWVLGRWALSSHEGHLRVATTLSPPWGPEPERSSSSVAVLAERDGGLVETGRVDGLGPGERIYAVRYFGDLATVVTFRQTDPLYVLDLADPTAPQLLGELKVPGFSTYLHPLGGDLLLGVGNDADEQGRVTGMQVSVFDLQDLSAPVQVDRLSFGQGWSPALDDSSAFGYDPARRLAVLPFSSWDVPGGTGTSAAVAVEVGDDGALRERGRLATDGEQPVDRVLLDGDRLYAVGSAAVVAGRTEDLRRTGAVRLPR